MALLSCTVGTRIPGFLLQVLAGTWVLLLCSPSLSPFTKVKRIMMGGGSPAAGAGVSLAEVLSIGASTEEGRCLRTPPLHDLLSHSTGLCFWSLGFLESFQIWSALKNQKR